VDFPTLGLPTIATIAFMGCEFLKTQKYVFILKQVFNTN